MHVALAYTCKQAWGSGRVVQHKVRGRFTFQCWILIAWILFFLALLLDIVKHQAVNLAMSLRYLAVAQLPVGVNSSLRWESIKPIALCVITFFLCGSQSDAFQGIQVPFLNMGRFNIACICSLALNRGLNDLEVLGGWLDQSAPGLATLQEQ